MSLLDDFADLVICRNALDHMSDPAVAVKEIWRVLNQDGALFSSVDIGGEPTPDEPTVFSVESLRVLLQEHVDVVSLADQRSPHSAGRLFSVRAVARKKGRARQGLNKHEIL